MEASSVREFHFMDSNTEYSIIQVRLTTSVLSVSVLMVLTTSEINVSVQM